MYVYVHVHMHVCTGEREFMLRGVRWAGNINFTLHSLSFYNTNFFLIAKKKVEKGSFVTYFKKSETRREFTHRCTGHQKCSWAKKIL